MSAGALAPSVSPSLPPRAEDTLGLDQAVDLFIARTRHTRSGSAHTERAYRTDLRDLARFLRRRRLALGAVTRAEAERYLAGLAARVQPRTVERRVSCVRSFYRFLRGLGHVDANPFDALDLPSYDRKSETHKVLSDAELARALDALADDVRAAREDLESARLSTDRSSAFARLFGAARLRAVVALAALCGLRSGEILGLPPSAFAVRDDGVTLTFRGKGGKTRSVPLTGSAYPALVDWLTIRRQVPTSADVVFVTLNGQPVHPSQIRREIVRLGLRVGLRFRLGPHALRRTFATRALRVSGNIRAVQVLLGHASIGTTEVYTHVDETGLRAIVEASARSVSPADSTPPPARA